MAAVGPSGHRRGRAAPCRRRGSACPSQSRAAGAGSRSGPSPRRASHRARPPCRRSAEAGRARREAGSTCRRRWVRGRRRIPPCRSAGQGPTRSSRRHGRRQPLRAGSPLCPRAAPRGRNCFSPPPPSQPPALTSAALMPFSSWDIQPWKLAPSGVGVSVTVAVEIPAASASSFRRLTSGVAFWLL